MLQDTTPGQMPPQEIEREMRATLAARREMGAEYDNHLIDAFMQKLDAYINQRLQSRPVPMHPRAGAASAGQRLALAIVSIALLIPLGGICIALPGGLLAFVLACGAVALINLFFAAGR